MQESRRLTAATGQAIAGQQSDKKPLPRRAELPAELTWDLSVVYADDAAWETDFERVSTQMEEFGGLANTLHQSPEQVLRCLRLRDKAGTLYSQVRAYASLRRSEDNGNPDAQARADRSRMLGTRLASATAFIEPELLSIPVDELAAFLTAQPDLELYRYYFETLERRRPHVRSAEVEDVLAQANEAMSSTGTVFTLFNNADLKFPAVRDEHGAEVELTHGRYLRFLESRDRGVRQTAFLTMHGEYARWRNTLAAALSGAVKANVCNARLRHYQSALQAALDPDAIPVEVYHNLIATVRERLPVLHRYLRLRKRILELPDLQLWDLYVPMVAEVDRPLAYQEAQRVVTEASRPLGHQYEEALRAGFAARWIDVLENEGKTSGAFSDGAYTTPPYILMNWQENLHTTFTLAHELGHSLHSFFTRRTQPYIYSDYTIFVAEVASTLNEALLTHHLLEQARRNDDRPLQMYLLNAQAEGFRTTLYRQTMFAEFELKIHQIVEAGEALTAESMSALYYGLNCDYYGAEVTVDESVAVEWSRIPHFYYDFYVYQYATGISAAAALCRQLLQAGPPAVERYLRFLSRGGSDTSINLLRDAGVDMTSPRPVHQALDVFDEVVGQLETLAG